MLKITTDSLKDCINELQEENKRLIKKGNSKISIIIYDLNSKEKYTLIESKQSIKENIYTIIINSPLGIYDSSLFENTYYCETIEEVYQMVNFILDNQECYDNSTKRSIPNEDIEYWDF